MAARPGHDVRRAPRRRPRRRPHAGAEPVARSLPTAWRRRPWWIAAPTRSRWLVHWRSTGAGSNGTIPIPRSSTAPTCREASLRRTWRGRSSRCAGGETRRRRSTGRRSTSSWCRSWPTSCRSGSRSTWRGETSSTSTGRTLRHVGPAIERYVVIVMRLRRRRAVAVAGRRAARAADRGAAVSACARRGRGACRRGAARGVVRDGGNVARAAAVTTGSGELDGGTFGVGIETSRARSRCRSTRGPDRCRRSSTIARRRSAADGSAISTTSATRADSPSPTPAGRVRLALRRCRVHERRPDGVRHARVRRVSRPGQPVGPSAPAAASRAADDR